MSELSSFTFSFDGEINAIRVESDSPSIFASLIDVFTGSGRHLVSALFRLASAFSSSSQRNTSLARASSLNFVAM